MKPWLRLVLVTLSVGGGFTGAIGTLESLSNSTGSSTINVILKVVFFALYAFVTISGLLFVNNPNRADPLLVSMALQVPSISSSAIVYEFSSALSLVIGVGESHKDNTSGITFGWNFFLGSHWRINFAHDAPLRVGVNAIALAAALCILQARRSIDRALPSGTSETTREINSTAQLS